MKNFKKKNKSQLSKKLALLNKFISIERVDYLNIYYMTRDLTDQKGCGTMVPVLQKDNIYAEVGPRVTCKVVLTARIDTTL